MTMTKATTERNCAALKKYRDHTRNARKGGKEFNLTFEAWLYLWLYSGHWDQRGRGGDQFVMSRSGDKGPYEVGNVFFQESRKNISQGNTGRKANYRMADCQTCGKGFKSNGLHLHVRKCAAASAGLAA
jgi:hypothetical protein